MNIYRNSAFYHAGRRRRETARFSPTSSRPLALWRYHIRCKNIELNASYATIANGGQYIRPKLYTIVKDHDGNVILDNTSTEGTQVIKPSTAFLLTSAMQDVVTSGFKLLLSTSAVCPSPVNRYDVRL